VIALSDAAPRSSDELQLMVDELAEEIGRSVVVNDPVVRLICSSRHFGDEDGLRIRAVLQRDAVQSRPAPAGRAMNHPARRGAGASYRTRKSGADVATPRGGGDPPPPSTMSTPDPRATR
jgi:hypothetical protein